MDQLVGIILKTEKNGSLFQFIIPNNCNMADLRDAATETLADVFDIIKQHQAAQAAAAKTDVVTPEILPEAMVNA